MKTFLLKQLVNVLVSMLDEQTLKKFIDYVLDFVEAQVLGSASKTDDAVVLPICDAIRRGLDVPDDD